MPIAQLCLSRAGLAPRCVHGLVDDSVSHHLRFVVVEPPGNRFLDGTHLMKHPLCAERTKAERLLRGTIQKPPRTLRADTLFDRTDAIDWADAIDWIDRVPLGPCGAYRALP